MIISAPVSLRGRNYLVRRGTSFFNKCNLCLVDNMDQFLKFLVLTKDQGLMTGIFGRLTTTSTATMFLILVV